MIQFLLGAWWRLVAMVVITLGFVVLFFTWPAAKIAQFGSWLAEAMLDYAASATHRGTTSGRWW
jgi:hypothetical protein